MPKAAIDQLCATIAELQQSATRFQSPTTSEALLKKWLDRVDFENFSDNATVCCAADAFLLIGDLLLSKPSLTGTTAFDRLAKSLRGTPEVARTVLTTLCRARFRLLRLEITTNMRELVARDVIANTVLRIACPDLPQLPAGLRLFARVVTLPGDICMFPGPITPLDDAAFAVARNHPAAGATGHAAGARWAEAVYCQIVCHGTLDIAGLNRPRDFFDPEEPEFDILDTPALQLGVHWQALGGRAPEEALLRRTRALADPDSMLHALAGATAARRDGKAGFADALERMLLVQLETAHRRAQAGSGRGTLEQLAHLLEHAIEEGLPDSARDLLARLRRRAASGSAQRPDDPAMERLLARIQALRAKTVARGCTEQEALAAAEKVAELLDRHGLSLGELEFTAQPCEGIGIQTTRRRMGPVDNCVTAIAAFFDCRVWVEQSQGEPLRYIFFGLRGDVAAAEYLYEMVERAFDTETEAFKNGDIYRAMHGERRSASNSFQLGMARSISAKLHTRRQSRDANLRQSSGRDLVPMKSAMIDEELAKLGLNMYQRSSGSSKKRVLTDAYEAGQAAGERFEIMPAISEAA